MARSNGGQGRRHRVAIVGGGFGGLFAALALRRAEVEVTVVDRTNHHLFQAYRARGGPAHDPGRDVRHPITTSSGPALMKLRTTTQRA